MASHPLTSPRAIRPAAGAAFAVWLAAAALPAPAGVHAADLAWTSHLYPAYFSDLVATGTDVWGATREGGLVRLDRATGTLERIVREPGGLTSNELTSLTLDRSGRLWVGTLASGVSRLRADRSAWDVVNRLDGLPSDAVTTLVAVGDTVWIGTAGGIALWNGRELSGSLPDPNTVSFDTTFAVPHVTGIAQVGDTLWVATTTGIGLARISNALSDWRPVNQGLATVAIEDLAWDGLELVAIGQGALHRFRADLGAWQLIGNPGAVSATGGPGWLLVATAAGVHRWTGTLEPIAGSPVPFRKPFDPYRDELRAVLAPDGAVFAGTGSFLHEQTPALAWLVHPVPAPWDNTLIGLATDGVRVYTQSFVGFSRWDGAAWRWWPSGNPCAGAGCDTTFRETSFGIPVFSASDGAKWAAFWSGGLDRFEDDTTPFTFRHLTESMTGDSAIKRTWVYSGAEDAEGRMWLGMDTPAADDPANQPLGLVAWSLAGDYLGTWGPRNSDMRGVYVRAVARDRFGRMWIGYRGQGVDWFQPHPAGSPTPVDSTDFRPLADTDLLLVRGIATHGDTLWVLSESDLRRYRLQPGGTPATHQQTWTNLPAQADLAVRPLAVQSDGTLWLATSEGLRVFRPGAGATEVQTIDAANSPLVTNSIRSLAFDGAGRLWIATDRGLQRFDPGYQPPPPPSIPSLAIRVFPNPVTGTALGVRLQLRSTAGTTVTGTVHDVNGRRVRSFQVSGTDPVFWDGRDQEGNLVKPGIYFVRATAGGREAFARIVLLR